MRFSAPKPCDRANCVCFACRTPIALGEPLSFESKKPHCMKCAAELPNKAATTAPMIDLAPLVDAISGLKGMMPDACREVGTGEATAIGLKELSELDFKIEHITKRQEQIEKRFEWLRDTICKELNLGECPF